jgi:hypothetical protein
MWQTLQEYNINNYLIEIIKELYVNNRGYIKQGNKLSQPIRALKDLWQGCGLSPLLFKIYLERMLKEWRRYCGSMGIPIDNIPFYLELYG